MQKLHCYPVILAVCRILAVSRDFKGIDSLVIVLQALNTFGHNSIVALEAF